MKKDPVVITLISLFLLNFIARFFLLSKGPYHADSLLLAVNAKETLLTFKIHYLQATGLPFAAILGAVFIALFKYFGQLDIVFAVNVMSVTFASLCVPLLYLIIRHIWHDHKAAVMGALILSLNTLLLGVSTYANSLTPSTFLFLLAFYILIRSVESDRNSTFFVSALFFGLLGATRLQDMVAMGPSVLIAYLAVCSIHRRSISVGNLMMYILFVCLVAGVFYVPSIVEKGGFGAGQFSAYYMKMIAMTLDKVDITTFRIIFKWILVSISYVGGLMAVIGLWLVFRDDKRIFLLSFALVFLPVAIYGSFWFSLPRMYLLPSIMLIIPLSYIFVLLNKSNKMMSLLLSIFLILSMIVNIYGVYKTVKFRHDYQLLPDFYTWMAEVTEPHALIIERDHSLFITYYANRVPLGVPVSLFETDQEELQAYKNKIDGLLEQGIPIYITDTGLNGYPKKFKFDIFMKEHFEFVLIGNKKIEDWYNGVLTHSVVDNALFRVHPKDEQGMFYQH